MFSPFWGNSPETVVAQTLAEEFGIDPSQVTVTYEDSQHGLPSAGPGGSRMTVMLTGAVVGAARKLKDKLARIAAHQLEAAAEDIAFADGRAMVRGAARQGHDLRRPRTQGLLVQARPAAPAWRAGWRRATRTIIRI